MLWFNQCCVIVSGVGVLQDCHATFLAFYRKKKFLQLYILTGISPMGNSGRFPGGNTLVNAYDQSCKILDALEFVFIINGLIKDSLSIHGREQSCMIQIKLCTVLSLGQYLAFTCQSTQRPIAKKS